MIDRPHRISRRRRRLPQRTREFLRLLVGILIMYVLILAVDNASASGLSRVLIFSLLLLVSLRLRHHRGLPMMLALVLAGSALLASVLAVVFGSTQLAGLVVGGSVTLLAAAAMFTVGQALLDWRRVDSATVLGVLCIYLLFALFFAAVHQVFAALHGPGYLNGVQATATSSDLLYFSVITLATVGFGDITPATGIARAVTVTEAMVGQLYLVSVVAGVVGGWRAYRADDQPSNPDGQADRRDSPDA